VTESGNETDGVSYYQYFGFPFTFCGCISQELVYKAVGFVAIIWVLSEW